MTGHSRSGPRNLDSGLSGQNPSTPELHQPLLFAPSELLACGLRDAHHHPLVGERTEDGVRSWRRPPLLSSSRL